MISVNQLLYSNTTIWLLSIYFLKILFNYLKITLSSLLYFFLVCRCCLHQRLVLYYTIPFALSTCFVTFFPILMFIIYKVNPMYLCTFLNKKQGLIIKTRPSSVTTKFNFRFGIFLYYSRISSISQPCI